MRRVILGIFLSLFLISGANASGKTEQNLDKIEKNVEKIFSEEESLNYKLILEVVDDIVKNIENAQISSKDTVSYIKYLSDFTDKIIVDKDALIDKISQSNKRLEALGTPVEGVVESKEVSSKRKVINKELSDQKSSLAQIDLLIAKINEVEDEVVKFRSKEFRYTNLDKKSALISPKNLYVSLKKTTLFLYDIIASPVEWYSSLDKKDISDVNSNIAPMLGAFVLFLLLVIYLNKFIRRKFGYKEGIDQPDYNTRFFAAIALSIAYGLIPLTVLGTFMFWIKSKEVLLNSFFGITLNSLAFYLLLMSLSQTIVRVLFAPSNSVWRLIEVDDYRAKKLGKSLLFSVITISITSWFLHVAKAGEYSSEVISLVGLISSAVKSLSIFLVFSNCFAEEEKAESNVDEEEISNEDKAKIVSSIAMIAVFSLSLFGYTSLSVYILNRIIGTALILIAFYVIYKIITDVIGYFIRMKALKYMMGIRLSRRFKKRFNFFANLFLIPAIIFLATLVILWHWGFSIDLMIVNIKRFLNGFYIGGVRISLSTIILSLIIFIVSFSIFRWLKSSLMTGVLSKSEIDEGIRNSLASGIGFFGFIISALFAIAVAGGSLKSLAIIAGALSFGVGLGLQSIVGNFVSGIILLFERPIKIGDWVNIGGEQGIVKQISIRSTKIQKFDRSTVIIPNGDILSGKVTNLTHGGRSGRISIPVGVAYGSSIPVVKQALIEAASENPNILKNPAPNVSFDELGDYALNLELKCFVANILNGSSVKTELRETILNKFEEYNIEIPFPKQVVELEKK